MSRWMTPKVRWITANMMGEGVALAMSALLGVAWSRIPFDLSLSAFALPTLMVITGFLEGCVVGAFQAQRLLVPRFRWALYNGLAFASVWGLGAFSSMFEPPDATGVSFAVVFAALMGGALGAAVGLAQHSLASLPEQILRNALGWSGAMVVLAVAADLVPYGPFGWNVLAINTGGGLIAGLVVGSLTLHSVQPILRD